MSASRAEPGCRFCLGNGLLVDEPVFANASHYFLGSIDPLLPVAGMIVPYRHSETPFTMTPTEWRDLGVVLDRAKGAFRPPATGWLHDRLECRGSGRPRGVHIICRFVGGHDEGIGLRRILKNGELPA